MPEFYGRSVAEMLYECMLEFSAWETYKFKSQIEGTKERIFWLISHDPK